MLHDLFQLGPFHTTRYFFFFFPEDLLLEDNEHNLEVSNLTPDCVTPKRILFVGFERRGKVLLDLWNDLEESKVGRKFQICFWTGPLLQ